MYELKFYEKYRILWEQEPSLKKIFVRLIEAMCIFPLFLVLRLSYSASEKASFHCKKVEALASE